VEVLFPDDVLAAILNFYPGDEFPAAREPLHRGILELEKEQELLNVFVFDEDKVFPYSEELDQAFGNLETSGLLGKFNPELRIYRISQNLRDYYTARLKTKFQAQEDELKDAACKLAALIATS